MTEHSAIERYIEALETKDFKALGDLFTSDGHYCDYCPNGTSQHEYHLYGKEAITMFFQNKFLFRQYSILSPVILNERQAEFIASFGGCYVMAIANLQQLSADGHIRRAYGAAAVSWLEAPFCSNNKCILECRFKELQFFSI